MGPQVLHPDYLCSDPKCNNINQNFTPPRPWIEELDAVMTAERLSELQSSDTSGMVKKHVDRKGDTRVWGS